MNPDLKKILYTKEEIAERVTLLAKRIEKDYAGKDVVCIGILKGAFIFMSDLVRQIDLPMTLDFMMVSSYGAGTESTGALIVKKDVDSKVINGKHVIIVEDIVDSGRTLYYLKKYLEGRGAVTMAVCTLLNKKERRVVDLTPEYCAFEDTPDEFVVGYGLDYAEKYRELPDIGVLRPQIYAKAK